MNGSRWRLAGYVKLGLQAPRDHRCHRVYKGSRPSPRDKVVLRFYDLSACDGKNVGAAAKREINALQKWQWFLWSPQILYSSQDAPGYVGEMYWFTIVDPAAPCMGERGGDDEWSPSAGIKFSWGEVKALAEFHTAGESEEPLVHRNPAPKAVLACYEGTPILTGVDRARPSSDISVVSRDPSPGAGALIHAPHLQLHRLLAADQRSDVCSLWAFLSGLFASQTDGLSSEALEILSTGQQDGPERRNTPADPQPLLSELLRDS
ncbi:MAG TPA: hypothetical protein ENJ16_00405, partial [Planctomycetaceae bacterium]|nr:hypothetical protein [Planctomycetaceae bacterium]